MNLVQLIHNFHNEESGQDLLEYALVLAAVLAAVVLGSSSLGSTIASALVVLDGKIGTTISKVS